MQDSITNKEVSSTLLKQKGRPRTTALYQTQNQREVSIMTEVSRNVIPAGATGENYPLLVSGAEQEIRELFRDNLGQDTVNGLDLPRDKCGAGGAIEFRVETADGEVSMRSITGIVADWRTARLFWREPADGKPSNRRRPPDCTSRDALRGEGDPGGLCSECPYAKFGTSAKGHGQACKQVRQLLIIHPGEIVPHLLTVPPTSLKSCSNYLLKLLSKRIPYWAVITRISLERAANQDGIEFAKLSFAVERRLTDGERQAFAPTQRQMKTLLDPLAVDYQSEEETARTAATSEQDTGEPPF
jgi:hypothetical protein